MKFTYFVLAITFLFIGCTSIKPDDPYGRDMPKRPDWTLNNKVPDRDRLICYESIYVHERSDDRRKRYGVLRFFPNGQFMSKATEDYNDDIVYNSFQSAVVGYFFIDSRGIVLEHFTSIGFGSYQITKGGVVPDKSISIVSFGQRGKIQHRYAEEEVYKKVSVDNLKPILPDW